MTSTTTTPLVPLADIAAELNISGGPRWVAEQLNKADFTVVTDWRGEPATTEPEARRLMEMVEAERVEARQLQRDYKAYRESRARERQRVREEAFTNAQKEHQAKEWKSQGNRDDYAFQGITGVYRMPSSGGSRTAGRQAAQEAAVKWDKKNPELDFNTWARKQKGKR